MESVHYKSVIFYSIGPWGLYHKTLQIRNLQKMDRFCSKLVSFGLDKHASLSKKRHSLTTESVHYESIMFFYDTGPWRPLEAPGGPWRPLEAPGGPWKPMEAPYHSLSLIVVLGGFEGDWQTL